MISLKPIFESKSKTAHSSLKSKIANRQSVGVGKKHDFGGSDYSSDSGFMMLLTNDVTPSTVETCIFKQKYIKTCMYKHSFTITYSNVHI